MKPLARRPDQTSEQHRAALKTQQEAEEFLNAAEKDPDYFGAFSQGVVGSLSRNFADELGGMTGDIRPQYMEDVEDTINQTPGTAVANFAGQIIPEMLLMRLGAKAGGGLLNQMKVVSGTARKAAGIAGLGALGATAGAGAAEPGEDLEEELLNRGVGGGIGGVIGTLIPAGASAARSGIGKLAQRLTKDVGPKLARSSAGPKGDKWIDKDVAPRPSGAASGASSEVPAAPVATVTEGVIKKGSDHPAIAEFKAGLVQVEKAYADIRAFRKGTNSKEATVRALRAGERARRTLEAANREMEELGERALKGDAAAGPHRLALRKLLSRHEGELREIAAIKDQRGAEIHQDAMKRVLTEAAKAGKAETTDPRGKKIIEIAEPVVKASKPKPPTLDEVTLELRREGNLPDQLTPPVYAALKEIAKRRGKEQVLADFLKQGRKHIMTNPRLWEDLRSQLRIKPSMKEFFDTFKQE